MEAGESAEHAVVREVAEEAGVVVDGWRVELPRQPALALPGLPCWAYHAWTAPGLSGGRGRREEIAEVRWFSRAEMSELAGAGEVKIPPSVSIARHLIEDWFGAGATWAVVR